MVLDVFVTHWIAVVPVKGFAAAKSRLATVPAPLRADLARAMADDTIAALRAAPSIHSIVVVYDGVDDFAPAGCVVLPGPGQDLNAAIRLAARTIAHEAPADYGLAIVAGDVPCLDAASVTSIVRFADRYSVSLVSDTAGTGTTMLLATNGRVVPDEFQPAFGPHSCAAHVAAGAINLNACPDAPHGALHRARRDVDTEVDLWDARRIGVGPMTRQIP